MAFKFFLFALRSIVAIWFLKNKSWLWYVKPNFQKKVKNPTFKKWIFLVCQSGKVRFRIGLASWFDFRMNSRLANKQTCHLLGNDLRSIRNILGFRTIKLSLESFKGQLISKQIYEVIVFPKKRKNIARISALTLRAEILAISRLFFWEKRWLHNFVLRFTDLYISLI